MPAGEAATFNRSELVSRDGQVLATYDKIHLFDVDLPDGNTYTESATINAGNSCRRWLSFQGSAALGSPFATTFASLSSTAIWREPVLSC